MATVTCASKTMLSTNTKPRRKQNRACDACKRGKRACDATGRASNEVCSNCVRTGKVCTFEKVLRTVNEKSNRKIKKNLPSTPLSQSRGSTQNLPEEIQSYSREVSDFSGYPSSLQALSPSRLELLDNVHSDTAQIRAGSQEAYDFPDINELCPSLTSEDFELITQVDSNGSTATSGWDAVVDIVHQRDATSEIETTPGSIFSVGTDVHSNSNSTGTWSRKRKTPPESQRSPRVRSPSDINCSSNVTALLAEKTNKSLISDSLTRIYQDTMENALSCWLTERTCPYTYEGIDRNQLGMTAPLGSQNPLESGNRVIARICHLDRPTSTLRERPLTHHENKIASRALKATIMAFSSQWAQSPSAVREATAGSQQFETLQGIIDGHTNGTVHGDKPTSFDRSLQESLWHDAQHALQECAEIDSYRVIFAQLLFSFTQKPLPRHQYDRIRKVRAEGGINIELTTDTHNVEELTAESYNSGFEANGSTSNSKAFDTSGEIKELQDLLELQGSPIHMEAALLQLSAKRVRLEDLRRSVRQGSTDAAGIADRKTFNMLFWMVMMCDTLLAVLYKRPCVVSDEDSLILHADPAPDSGKTPDACEPTVDDDLESSPWGTLFLKKAELNVRARPSIWPMADDHALSLLADAATVKVLLYRKVKRLSNCMFRGNSAKRIEAAIVDALNVYEYWNKTYGEFILTCLKHHDDLHARVQSWYSVLIGHWHLAVFWLADCLDEVDQRQKGDHLYGALRKSCRLAFEMRKASALQISDVCRVARPRDDSSFNRIGNFHTTVCEGALLTEPWTEILIRCFTRSADLFLKWLLQLQSSSTHPSSWSRAGYFDALYDNCMQCIAGLFDIGRKSDMSYLLALSLLERLQNTFPNARTNTS
nr:hypothetical protein LTR18_002601 [Exophiala xenobiotica]